MTRATSVQAFADADHDHRHCVAAALNNAARICRERGLRFTRQRRKVLELVWSSHKPVGAYEILESLNRAGQRTAPPTVYRALEFLIEADLVHRIDSLNAFIGCPDPGNPHVGQFLICGSCQSVAELDDREIARLVDRKAADLGFEATHQSLEIRGLCRACR